MPVPDRFDGDHRDFLAPGYNAFAITPADGSNLVMTTRAIYVGAPGDVSAVMAGAGNTVIFKGLAAGSLLPIAVVGINATGTSCTDIVGIF